MKTHSEELYKLIKSLDTQEKVQFKLYASRKKGNTNYIKLFDTLDKQKTYDEQKAKKKLGGEPFAKNFAWAKHYLHGAILSCLQEYYASNSIDAVLGNYIQQIEILVSKQLYDSAGKLIHKAEKLAEENHLFQYLINIFIWKRKLMVLELNQQELDNYGSSLYLKEIQCADKHKNSIEYQKIAVQVKSVLNTRRSTHDTITIEKTKKLLQHPLLRSEDRALSYPAKFQYHVILGDIYSVLKNDTKSLSCYKTSLSYFETAQTNVNEHIAVYFKIITLLYWEENKGEMERFMNEAENLINSLPDKLQSQSLKNQYSVFIFNNILSQKMVSNIEEALILSERIRLTIDYTGTTSMKMAYYTNAFMYYFLSSDYRNALRCINKVLSLEKTNVRKEIIFFVKILNILTHYELGNDDMVGALCRSDKRYFDKQTQPYLAEKIILNFFTHIILKTKTNREKTMAFTKLKKDLEVYRNEQVFRHFDFISWAESKIENRPLLDIFKEKILSH